jgi:3-deoxy-D-manno-octulosonate 8-phosphate phosphatase (KDO 8-P phosphatase)
VTSLPIALRQRAAAIRLVIFDVDGVMTDGTLWYGADGEVLKPFHVRDGLGVKLLRRVGIEVAVISGRQSAALERRLADLPIEHVFLGRDDKGNALDELLGRTGIPVEAMAHVGDDVLDLAPMRRVGLGIAVQDAHAAVLAEADWVTQSPGGRGAVREVADGLLDARGDLRQAWEELLEEKHRRSGG